MPQQAPADCSGWLQPPDPEMGATGRAISIATDLWRRSERCSF